MPLASAESGYAKVLTHQGRAVACVITYGMEQVSVFLVSLSGFWLGVVSAGEVGEDNGRVLRPVCIDTRSFGEG